MAERVDVNQLMQKAQRAAAIFSQLDQEHTDRIVKAVFRAGFDNRIKLAEMACAETKLGNVKDKIIKNVVATQFVYESIKNMKTVGIISEDEFTGITEIAQPLGPIFAITPVTNPTSTVMFKILISLKSRNPIIIRPHRNAAGCSIEAAKICYEAALSEDAPEDCIQWASDMTREETQEIMGRPNLALVLATGGGGLVKAAYSSGTPAIGVGAGNVPVYIEKSADIPFAVESILKSKTFDYGTVCASEQACVVETEIAEKVIHEFERNGGYFLTGNEIPLVENAAFDKEKQIMNADIIGQPASEIAKRAGIKIPENVKLLIAPLKGVGKDYPLSSEILAPILAFYVVESHDEAINTCIRLNYHGGIGHTASIFSNDDDKIKNFSLLMNAGRIVVNMPSSQGAVGGIYNTLNPSLTLGCGTGGKNITTDNISASHLLNIQRISRRRMNQRLANFNEHNYFDVSYNSEKIEADFNHNF
jgi:acetaldehyde dehydrogenase/alcohol dehydrogenase